MKNNQHLRKVKKYIKMKQALPVNHFWQTGVTKWLHKKYKIKVKTDKS